MVRPIFTAWLCGRHTAYKLRLGDRRRTWSVLSALQPKDWGAYAPDQDQVAWAAMSALGATDLPAHTGTADCPCGYACREDGTA